MLKFEKELSSPDIYHSRFTAGDSQHVAKLDTAIKVFKFNYQEVNPKIMYWAESVLHKICSLGSMYSFKLFKERIKHFEYIKEARTKI